MTREDFTMRLADLESQVSEMAQLAKGMLHDSVAALEQLDRDAAEDVASRAEMLAQMDEDIEHAILQFLTLQSPVARDLRRIGAALKLITYLNRVGRYGFDIAKVTLSWPEGRPHVARMVSTREMAAKVLHMLDITLQAFHDRAAPDAAALAAVEEDVDALRYSVWRECLTYMAEDSRHIEPCAHYMMVARYLERCGDNVCKMAEKLHYAATGKRIIIG